MNSDSRAVTATASDHRSGVAIEVGPGGGVLRGLTITSKAMRARAESLARTPLRHSATATATANQRALLALEQHLTGLSSEDRSALGLHVDPAQSPAVEHTVPATWEVL